MTKHLGLCIIEFIKWFGGNYLKCEFEIFNDTFAQMLDSVYHMALKLFHLFGVKKAHTKFCHM